MGHRLRRRSQSPGRPDGRVRPAAPVRGTEPPHRTGHKRSVPSVPLAHPHLGAAGRAVGVCAPSPRPLLRRARRHRPGPSPPTGWRPARCISERLPSPRETRHGCGTEVGAGGAGHGPAAADALVEVCAGKSPGRSEPVVCGRPAARRGAHATCGPRRAFPTAAQNAGGADAPRRTRVQSDASTCRRAAGTARRRSSPSPAAIERAHSALRRTAQTCSHQPWACSTRGSRANSVRAALSGRVTQDALTRRWCYELPSRWRRNSASMKASRLPSRTASTLPVS
jgi:hypothetical protein